MNQEQRVVPLVPDATEPEHANIRRDTNEVLGKGRGQRSELLRYPLHVGFVPAVLYFLDLGTMKIVAS